MLPVHGKIGGFFHGDRAGALDEPPDEMAVHPEVLHTQLQRTGLPGVRVEAGSQASLRAATGRGAVMIGSR